MTAGEAVVLLLREHPKAGREVADMIARLQDEVLRLRAQRTFIDEQVKDYAPHPDTFKDDTHEDIIGMLCSSISGRAVEMANNEKYIVKLTRVEALPERIMRRARDLGDHRLTAEALLHCEMIRRALVGEP